MQGAALRKVILCSAEARLCVMALVLGQAELGYAKNLIEPPPC